MIDLVDFSRTDPAQRRVNPACRAPPRQRGNAAERSGGRPSRLNGGGGAALQKSHLHEEDEEPAEEQVAHALRGLHVGRPGPELGLELALQRLQVL